MIRELKEHDFCPECETKEVLIWGKAAEGFKLIELCCPKCDYKKWHSVIMSET